MSATASIHDCCGFAWDRATTLSIYIAGPDASPAAILLIHDLYGRTFPNLRLLADHLAAEVGVTVYRPDFFGGETEQVQLLMAELWDLFDVKSFMARNGRVQRKGEIFAFARAMRQQKGHVQIASVGYCYGGWSSFRLGAREHEPPLVDCISAWITRAC